MESTERRAAPPLGGKKNRSPHTAETLSDPLRGTMARPAEFQVDPRLAALLGAVYRSSGQAIQELVDNAWDADAENDGSFSLHI